MGTFGNLKNGMKMEGKFWCTGNQACEVGLSLKGNLVLHPYMYKMIEINLFWQ
jgi:hypothetical protein